MRACGDQQGTQAERRTYEGFVPIDATLEVDPPVLLHRRNRWEIRASKSQRLTAQDYPIGLTTEASGSYRPPVQSMRLPV